MHALDILGDPVRRRILELLRDGELASGDIVKVITKEFDLTQPAVSYQLRVLRQNGFAEVYPDAQRRIYSLRPEAFKVVADWLTPFQRFWDHKLDALSTEVARGKKRRDKSV